MNFSRTGRAAAALLAAFAVVHAQPRAPIEPSFSLSITGKTGNRAEYRYLLTRAGDSAVITVNGTEKPVGWAEFRRLRHAVVKYAMDLTESGYGEPKDSADFSGELAISALDRNSIIKLNASLTLGTLENVPMAGLLRLLMRQVDDSLRLANVPFPDPPKKKRAAAPPGLKDAGPPAKKSG